MLRPMLIALLLAVPATGARSAAPDCSEYQSLLDRYLVRVDPRAKETDTRFDYERLYVDERMFQQHRSPLLERIHAGLTDVHPAELAPAERLAWAINTYNFLVLERATQFLIAPGKKPVRQRAVEDMRSPAGGFFAAPVCMIDGRRYSLAEFERRFVYDDTTSVLEARAVATDPRRWLALCSGHLGDPPLAPRAYRADSLEAQLDAAARTALALPRFVRLHEDSHQLDLSDVIARRFVDFGGTIDGAIPFVERYAPPEVRKAIRKYPIRRVTLVMPADPALNQFPRAHANAPATTS